MSDGHPAEAGGQFESEFALNERFDFNYEVRPKRKYVILCSPRTGSTVLAGALYDTGLAGVPFEYFHPELLRAKNNPELRPNELGRYFDDLIRRRTSPNGYFGMKLRFSQFERLFGRNQATLSTGIRFLSEFDKIIYVYRRDKVLQAVSLYSDSQAAAAAGPTPLASDPPFRRALTPDDVVEISDLVAAAARWDQAWRKVTSGLASPVHEVAYEDLTRDPGPEFDRIFDFLELTELRGRPTTIPAARKSESALADEWKAEYLQRIGVFEQTGVELSQPAARLDEAREDAFVRTRGGSLPDFLIIGASKCGTTALAFNLGRHPDVFMAQRNESVRDLFFFNWNWRQGVDWYRNFFPHPEKMQGEKTADYLFRTETHARMAAVVPHAKIIVSIRNPVDRAYSQWNHFNQSADEAKRWGWRVMPFRDAIAHRSVPALRSLLDEGAYITSIKNLLKFYPREKIHFVVAERMRSDRESEYAKLLEFLGLPPAQEPFKDLHVRRYQEPLDVETRQYLKSHFADSNAELFAFLGEEIAEWN